MDVPEWVRSRAAERNGDVIAARAAPADAWVVLCSINDARLRRRFAAGLMLPDAQAGSATFGGFERKYLTNLEEAMAYYMSLLTKYQSAPQEEQHAGSAS